MRWDNLRLDVRPADDRLTTPLFERVFGLESLAALPRLDDLGGDAHAIRGLLQILGDLLQADALNALVCAELYGNKFARIDPRRKTHA